MVASSVYGPVVAGIMIQLARDLACSSGYYDNMHPV